MLAKPLRVFHPGSSFSIDCIRNFVRLMCLEPDKLFNPMLVRLVTKRNTRNATVRGATAPPHHRTPRNNGQKTSRPRNTVLRPMRTFKKKSNTLLRYLYKSLNLSLPPLFQLIHGANRVGQAHHSAHDEKIHQNAHTTLRRRNKEVFSPVNFCKGHKPECHSSSTCGGSPSVVSILELLMKSRNIPTCAPTTFRTS